MLAVHRSLRPCRAAPVPHLGRAAGAGHFRLLARRAVASVAAAAWLGGCVEAGTSSARDERPGAIVGLGLMGEVFAQRLIDAGIPVTGTDIDPARRARLAEIGGRPAASIAELA